MIEEGWKKFRLDNFLWYGETVDKELTNGEPLLSFIKANFDRYLYSRKLINTFMIIKFIINKLYGDYSMIFDREIELDVLRNAVRSSKAELIIIYGRRRLGKTTVVREFLSEVNGVYLFTPRGSIEDILNVFSDDIREQTGDLVMFPDWRSFLEYIKMKSKSRFVIAIDEFQRIGEAYSPAMTLLQHYWDSYLSRSKIVLLLVGSVVGMVEKIALVGDSPLFGRRTRELKIAMMPYLVTRKYWRKYSEEERIEAFGFFGGTPGYFTLVDDNMTPIENVENLILAPDARLANEPEYLLTEETRTPSTYMSILFQISQGKRGLPLSKIKTRKGTPTVYLRTLSKMGIIDRLESLAQGNKVYTITDEFFRFWFKFIYPRQSLLEAKRGYFIKSKIEEEKGDYLSYTFEKILRELIVFSSGKTLKDVEMPIVERIGSYWWRELEVDACATARDTVIVGEAKWEEKTIRKRDVEMLIKKMYQIKEELKKKHVIGIILTKGEIGKRARNMEGENIILLDLTELSDILDKLYNNFPSKL